MPRCAADLCNGHIISRRLYVGSPHAPHGWVHACRPRLPAALIEREALNEVEVGLLEIEIDSEAIKQASEPLGAASEGTLWERPVAAGVAHSKCLSPRAASVVTQMSYQQFDG